jgi:acetolactate synthase-1/2/3 large subunit
MATCSEVIAGYLAALGVRHVFGYPGDPNVEVIEAARRRGLAFVLARREGTAGFMAQAYGQLTGLPGACLSTLGPGASNLVNAVANAHLDRAPMLAFSGQIEGKRAATFTHQVLDHGRLFGPISKWTAEVRPDNAGAVMRKAIRLAVAERPGPVHLTTPADVVGATATDSEIAVPPLQPALAGAEIVIGAGARDPHSMLTAARRPVAIAGIAAVRGGASASLARFAETVGCPVVVAPMAKGVLPEDHPYYAGTLDMACNRLIWEFLEAADLIVTIGFDAVELIKPWSPGARVLHVDSTPNTDQIVPAEVEMVGPIPALVAHLASSFAGEPRWEAREIASHRERLAAAYHAGRVAGRLNPSDVIDVVRSAMPREAIVSADVGSHKLLVGQGWTTYAPNGVLMSNGLSSMGYSLPAAMTAKLLMPEREVVCFIGDGGLAMVQGELRLAASLGLGLVVVVFCDNSLNRIELKQQARQYPAEGTRFEPTDMGLLARSMACDGTMVETAAALQSALAGRTPRRPLVIGATIDPAQYMEQF